MTGSFFFAIMNDDQYVLTRSNVVTWLIVFNWLLNRKPLEDINFFREQCISSTHDHPTLRLHELKDTDIPFGDNLSYQSHSSQALPFFIEGWTINTNPTSLQK